MFLPRIISKLSILLPGQAKSVLHYPPKDLVIIPPHRPCLAQERFLYSTLRNCLIAWTNINQSIDHGRAPLPHCAQQFEKQIFWPVLYWCCDDVWGFFSIRQHSIWSGSVYMALSVPTRHVAAARSHLIIWRTTHKSHTHTFLLHEGMFFFLYGASGATIPKACCLMHGQTALRIFISPHLCVNEPTHQPTVCHCATLAKFSMFKQHCINFSPWLWARSGN